MIASIAFLQDKSEIVQLDEICNNKFPNHDWAYECFDFHWRENYFQEHLNTTKCAIKMIEDSGLPTIMDYSKFLKK